MRKQLQTHITNEGTIPLHLSDIYEGSSAGDEAHPIIQCSCPFAICRGVGGMNLKLYFRDTLNRASSPGEYFYFINYDAAKDNRWQRRAKCCKSISVIIIIIIVKWSLLLLFNASGLPVFPVIYYDPHPRECRNHFFHICWCDASSPWDWRRTLWKELQIIIMVTLIPLGTWSDDVQVIDRDWS